MSARTSRGRGRSIGAADDAGDGAVARVIDHAIQNPAMSGGLVVMALTSAAIASNAMFLQNTRHPDPLFATRPMASRPAPVLPDVVPIPQSRGQALSFSAPLPSPRPSPPAMSETMVSPPLNVATEVQRELARLGLYTGAIDGIAGPRTEAAIAAYQKAAGLDATGKPSLELLETIKSPPAAEIRPTEPLAAAQPLVEPTQPIVQSAAIQPDASTSPDTAVVQADLYRLVQSALNEIGYGPIFVDGHPGAETANAIRRFELDNGLPLTGQVGDRVIGRLVSIGAMQAV